VISLLAFVVEVGFTATPSEGIVITIHLRPYVEPDDEAVGSPPTSEKRKPLC